MGAAKGRIVIPFDAFVRFGAKPAEDAKLRPQDVISVRYGFGGYYGQEGERFVFETARPRCLSSVLQ